MKFSNVILSILSANAVGAITVHINATTSGLNKPDNSFKIIQADLYKLNDYEDLEVTKLKLVDSQDAPAASVECRAYKDADGLMPGSAAFSGSQEAYLSTNTVVVGSITCYGIGVIPSSA